MNETYSELREHTLNDIKQVIDFYRLEITDDPETHNTIEGSLAETIAEWVSMDYEQIEITSSSMGDDLIISVLYTDTTDIVDDQFVVVHNEHDMFDNGGKFLSEMLENIDLSNFEWNYDFTLDADNRLDDISFDVTNTDIDDWASNIDIDVWASTWKPEAGFNTGKIHTSFNDVLKKIELNLPITDEIDNEGICSKPFII